MSKEYKSLEYLDLDIKHPENYNLCRRLTTNNNKIVCCFRENFSHRLHSTSNSDNFEQLNTIIDLLCSLSEKLKINSIKINETTEATDKAIINKNLIYLKQLLEDIFSNLKENIEIKNLLAITKRVEAELSNNNKLLQKILYGKQRT